MNTPIIPLKRLNPFLDVPSPCTAVPPLTGLFHALPFFLLLGGLFFELLYLIRPHRFCIKEMSLCPRASPYVSFSPLEFEIIFFTLMITIFLVPKGVGSGSLPVKVLAKSPLPFLVLHGLPFFSSGEILDSAVAVLR